MLTLKHRILIFIFMATATVCLGILCAGCRLVIPSVAFLAVTASFLIFLWRTLVQYSTFKLVTENEIIGISPAEISVERNGGGIPLEKVIVSTFGVLVDNRIFLWGVGQTRLKEAAFSRERLSLWILTDKDDYHIRLIHGISDPAAIRMIAAEISYETGVIPTIEGWDHWEEKLEA